MTTENKFEHTALSSPSREFRVITISPFKDTGDIRCKLSTRSLDIDKFTYHALSYLWGAETPSYTIQVDGKGFRVRENLWRFLRRAQRRFHDIPFFIDAICIDQTNLHERNQQVQMMGEIYTHSELTIAWLGEGIVEADSALPFVRGISHLTLLELQNYYVGYDRRQRQQAWSSVYTLCNLRYWSRVWIVQEILKPKSILLVYGEHELPWDQVSTFLANLRLADPCPAPLPEELFSSRLSNFDQTRDVGSSGSASASMKNILLDYRSSHCSEKRDRIFALLSLGVGGDPLKVDYGMHLCDLFLEAIRLWAAPSGDTRLILAKHLADDLLPLPADYVGQEHQSKTFIVKLFDSCLTSNHHDCAGADMCLSSESTIRAYGYDDGFTKDCIGSGKTGREVPVPCLNGFDSPPAMLQLNGVRHSQLHCQDIVLQIEGTDMFVVARSVRDSLGVVARLSVIVDEVNQTSRIVSSWLPWSKTLDKTCDLTSHGNGQFSLSFNAYSLRCFLIFARYAKSKVELRSKAGVRTVLYESLSWADPPGSKPIGAICRLQARHRWEIRRPEPTVSSAEGRKTLSIAQAHQALRSGRLDLTFPEDFQPTPSWKELLGRT